MLKFSCAKPREPSSESSEDANDKQSKLPHIKIILLGPTNSGKTSFLRQMRILYMNGFPTMETNRNVAFLRECALSSMQIILNYITQAKFSALKPAWVPLLAATSLTEETALTLTACWKDPLVKRIFTERTKHGLNELPANTSYYFDNCERFAHSHYLPSNEDILQMHIPTTGVSEVSLSTPYCHSTILDVGGSPASRRKWNQIDTEGLSGAVYFVALDSYGIPSPGGSSDGLLDSLGLFQEVTKSPNFSNCNWTLALNKADLFTERLSKTRLNQVYKNVSPAEGSKFEPAVAYILSTFTRVYGGKLPLSHVVCSVIDQQQISKISHHIFQHALNQDVA